MQLAATRKRTSNVLYRPRVLLTVGLMLALSLLVSYLRGDGNEVAPPRARALVGDAKSSPVQPTQPGLLHWVHPGEGSGREGDAVEDAAHNGGTTAKDMARLQTMFQFVQLVKRSNPDIAEKLPLHIDPPNVRANPCWLNATGALSCLPYVMLAGGLHCGVPDLYQRLAAHHDVASSSWHDAAPHWWSQQPGSVGSFDRYTAMHAHRLRRGMGTRAAERSASVVTMDASPDTFSFHATPIEELTLPVLIATVYAPSPPPYTVLLLRDPTDRLWAAFFANGENAHQYEPTLDGFRRFFAEASATWQRCVDQQQSVRLCALRLETLGVAQLIQGMYSVFMEDWQASIPPERLTVLRSEDYFGHVAQVKPPPLAFLWRWLHLAEPTERDWRAAAAHAAEDGPLEAMTTDMRALVDTFYAPFNQRLAEQLEDDAFLWKS